MSQSAKKQNISQKKPLEIKTPKIESKRNRNIYFSLIVFLSAFLVYVNTINHGYILDDYGVLKDNWIIKSGVSGIPTILTTTYRYGINHLTDKLYRPVPLVMYAIEWQISPDNPSISHFINILFYALACLSLFIFLKRLLIKYSIFYPFMIALLFAVHPIHTEVVANIKSRDEIMSFLFLMWCFIFFIKYLDKNKIIYLLASMLTYFLSFLSKEGVVTMLVIFPMLVWYLSETSFHKNIIISASMLFPAMLYIGIRQIIITKYNVDAPTTVIDNFLASSPNFLTQFVTATWLLGKYILIMFVPYPLICDYGYQYLNFIQPSDFRFILSFIIYIALVAFVLIKFRKKLIIVFGIIFFIAGISLYSNIFMTIGAAFAERFLFLPSLGFCIAVIMLFSPKENSEKPNQIKIAEKKFPKYAFTPILLILLVFSGITISRAADWKSQYILFGKDVKKAPTSAHLRLWWGLALRDEAMDYEDVSKKNQLMQQAVAEFDAGLKIYPTYPDCYEQLGLAWYRLGNKDIAFKNYTEALKYNPEKAVTYSNLGILYFESGDYVKSLELYLKATELDPSYADGWFNLGSTYGMTAKYDLAIKAFEECIKYDPENAKAHEFMGVTYQNMHQPEKAKPWLEKAKQIEINKKKNKKTKQ